MLKRVLSRLVHDTEEKTCSPVGVVQDPCFMVETYLQSFELCNISGGEAFVT